MRDGLFVKRKIINHISTALLPTLLGCTFSVHALDDVKIMRIASLEWLPYVSPTLVDGGLAVAISAAAMKHEGYDVKIDYFPWNRAVQMGSKNPEFAGYFPTYYTAERARQCYFSARFGTGMVGLAYRKDAPLAWNSLQDLTTKSIGVVAGYSNGEAFDAMVKNGTLKPELSQSDGHDLRKLVAGRVQAIVIDKAVLRYLLLTENYSPKDREQIVFHDKLLAELSMHICFQRTPAGLAFQQAYDAGLKKINIRKFENDYFQRLEQKGSGQSVK